MVEIQIQWYCPRWIPVEISRGPEISTGIDKKLFLDHFHNLICCPGKKTSPSAKAFLAPTKGHFGQFWCHRIPQMKKIPNFGRRYILKYGSNRKSKREFQRVKIGQRTGFWGLEDPRIHLDTKSDQLWDRSGITGMVNFGISATHLHVCGARKFYGSRNFNGTKSKMKIWIDS